MTICDRKYNFNMGRYTITMIWCGKCRRGHYNLDALTPSGKG